MTRIWSTRADVLAALDKEWTSGRLLAARVPVPDPPDTDPPAADSPDTDRPGTNPPAAPDAAWPEPDAAGSDRPPADRPDTNWPETVPPEKDSPDTNWPRVTGMPWRAKLASPGRADLASRWPEVTAWARDLSAWSPVRVEHKQVSHPAVGRQEVPGAVCVDSIDVATALLRKITAARRFDALVNATPPAFHRWMAAHPHRVLVEADEWTHLVAATEWLAEHDVSGRYARQLEIPGVHTKVLETHKRTVAGLLAEVRDRPRPTWGRHWFEDSLGLRRKPRLVRSRVLDPDLALIPGVTDLAMPITAFADLDPPGARTVFVTENELNYLTMPAAPGALVVFGSGNEAPELLGATGWIAQRPVYYWGDIDTHGFAILDRLRAVIPGVQSMLMDRDTLLAHRDAWVREPSPTRRLLDNLTPDEEAVYADLCCNSYGQRVRLEQERITYSAVARAVAART